MNLLDSGKRTSSRQAPRPVALRTLLAKPPDERGQRSRGGDLPRRDPAESRSALGDKEPKWLPRRFSASESAPGRAGTALEAQCNWQRAQSTSGWAPPDSTCGGLPRGQEIRSASRSKSPTGRCSEPLPCHPPSPRDPSSEIQAIQSLDQQAGRISLRIVSQKPGIGGLPSEPGEPAGPSSLSSARSIPSWEPTRTN